MQDKLRQIPSVSAVLSDVRISELMTDFSTEAITDLIRKKLSQVRSTIDNKSDIPTILEISNQVSDHIERNWVSWPKNVINATGVVIHTNLGRAPLSIESMQAAIDSSKTYSDLELELDSGKRGSRQARISQLLSSLTGAEAGLVVNNNAAALMLGLSALASGKEVIVSRSEAVEIGGGFRIPDVLKQSGATLIEVGTTNRTYVTDYEKELREETGAIFSIHASNFKIIGFTANPSITDLSILGTRSGIPVLHDVGSGSLIDPTKYGLAPEPLPQESIDAGADLCFFSGDKLLGGPQAGIVVGRKTYIEQLSNHPLARAFRIDKMNLAALTVTLIHYLKEEAQTKIPIWQMISVELENLRTRADRLATMIPGSDLYSVKVIATKSTIGGGSLPGETMDSYGIQVKVSSPEKFARKIRTGITSVIPRIEKDAVIFDLRTILQIEDDALIASITHTLQN
ncbi:MAG: L-seryl-tRNA(Sec) selenium transferase [SAR202 cluster bacterium]|nr:L-seryl-tRNA(Sec) selenium transferase [SAR202 cluster bacterium]|tara:strand:- start:13305 stop:14675 length:1371 start_codon:yes stop_codon:yes gene_type:complete